MCSNHTLGIETGRHDNKPREERSCQLCDIGETEDEDYFIMKCPAYDEIRNQYLGSTNHTDIKNLLSEREPLNVATFLRKSYTLREQILEEQPAEKYHIAQKKGLKMLIRKGPKTHMVSNVEKDGLKIKLKIVP